MLKSYAIVIVAAAVMAGLGALSAPAAAELSGEIQFGVITPLSGDLANFGEENSIARKIAIADFNAYLEEKDAPWYLSAVREDSQTLPTVALEKVQSFHSKNIKYAIGPETSASLQSIKGYVDSNGMLVISCCSTSPLLAIAGDNIFRTVSDDTNQAAAITRLLEDSRIDVIVPVWRNDAWGVGLKNALHEAFSASGGVVDAGLGYNPENSDFSTEASLLAEIVQGHVDEHGAENVGVMYIGFGEAILFFQTVHGYDVLREVMWFGSAANANDTRLIDDPLSLEFSTDTKFTTMLVASDESDLTTYVEESVAQRLGHASTAYASSSYDAIWLLGLALERTQSTDVDALAEAIPEVARERVGALGDLDLNAAGDLAQANYDILRVTGGGWQYYGTYEATSDSIAFAAMDGDADGEKATGGEAMTGDIP